MQAAAVAETGKIARVHVVLAERLQVRRKLLPLEGLLPQQLEHVVAELILIRKMIAVDLGQSPQDLLVELTNGPPMLGPDRNCKPVVVAVIADRRR